MGHGSMEEYSRHLRSETLPKIKDFRFHDLRHTGISMPFWHGFKIEEVAVVSRHKKRNTLRRYTHIRPEDLHRSLEALKKSGS